MTITPAENHAGVTFVMLVVMATVAVVARKSAFYHAELAKTQGRELTLDGLRGLAALSVMVYHAAMARAWFCTGKWGFTGSEILNGFGPGGVLIFFMLTGHLFWSKARAANGTVDVGKLWRGRFRRIAPLYLFSVVLVLIILFCEIGTRLFEWKNLPSVLRVLALGVTRWTQIGGVYVNDINASVAWTLEFEWKFYLVLPAIAWFAVGQRTWWFVLPVVVVAEFFISWDVWLTFGFGLITTVLLSDPETRTQLNRPAAAVAAVIASILFCIALNGWLKPVLSFAGALFPVFLVAAAGNTFFGLLTHPAVRCLGAVSYSLYLLHGIAWYVMTRGLKAAGIAEMAAVPFWLVTGVVAVAVTLLCCVTYRWIEFPFLGAGKGRGAIGGTNA